MSLLALSHINIYLLLVICFLPVWETCKNLRKKKEEKKIFEMEPRKHLKASDNDFVVGYDICHKHIQGIHLGTQMGLDHNILSRLIIMIAS